MRGNKWGVNVTPEKWIGLSWMSNQTLSNGNALFIPFLAYKFYILNTPLMFGWSNLSFNVGLEKYKLNNRVVHQLRLHRVSVAIRLAYHIEKC